MQFVLSDVRDDFLHIIYIKLIHYVLITLQVKNKSHNWLS